MSRADEDDPMRPRESLEAVDVTDRSGPRPRGGAVVRGVLLAAGTSSRYGERNKLLEPVDGDPLVVHAVRTLLASSLEGVTVVVGHERDRVREALAGLAVTVAANPDYRAGQATSLRTGLERVRSRDADAVVVALGDMPHVDPTSVDRLVDAFEYGLGDALAAAYRGVRGNPVCFGSRHFDALAAVDGDVGGRDVLRTAADAVAVETDDPGVLCDVDRPGDRRRHRPEY